MDYGLQDRISRAASHQIHNHYRVERFVRRTEAVYVALLNGHIDDLKLSCAE